MRSRKHIDRELILRDQPIDFGPTVSGKIELADRTLADSALPTAGKRLAVAGNSTQILSGIKS
jgi:hypothetical protein